MRVSPPRASFFFFFFCPRTTPATQDSLTSPLSPPRPPHPHSPPTPPLLYLHLSDARRGSTVCYCRFYVARSMKCLHRTKGKFLSTHFYYFTRNTYLATQFMWYYGTNLIKLSSEHNLCPVLIKNKTGSSKPTERIINCIQSNFNRWMDFDKDRQSNTIELIRVMSSITVVGKRLDFDSHCFGYCT